MSQAGPTLTSYVVELPSSTFFSSFLLWKLYRRKRLNDTFRFSLLIITLQVVKSPKNEADNFFSVHKVGRRLFSQRF